MKIRNKRLVAAAGWLGARLAAWLIVPLVPALVALTVLLGVYVIVFGRRL